MFGVSSELISDNTVLNAIRQPAGTHCSPKQTNGLRTPLRHDTRRSLMICNVLRPTALVFLASSLALGQSTPTDVAPERESTHLFWVMPNYRASPSLTHYEPLTVRQKFALAMQDSWDRGTLALAAVFGAENQLTNSNRAFGQGTAGYARYPGTSYGDFVIANYMSEAVFPSLLHQDPRYFRRGTGSGWSRLGYALGHTFRTHNDSGRSQFNVSFRQRCVSGRI